MPYRIALSFCLLLSLPITLAAQPVGTTHLTDFTPTDGLYRRLLGSVGEGSSGVPVAGGFDMDKDGIRDYAMAAMRAYEANVAAAEATKAMMAQALRLIA